MAADGYGYTQIRDYLNAHGYRHADGRLFTAHFYDILRNKKYIGEYIYNRAQKTNSGKEITTATNLQRILSVFPTPCRDSLTKRLFIRCKAFSTHGKTELRRRSVNPTANTCFRAYCVAKNAAGLSAGLPLLRQGYAILSIVAGRREEPALQG